MALHRVDGVEQYFTRAYEFGYSFSVEETLQKWGKEQILSDIVRLIRTIRPDVVVSLPPRGEGGGQHHQTSAILTKEAFRAAADPERFPEQIRAGLPPWQPLKLYSRLSVGPGGRPRTPPGQEEETLHLVKVDTGAYDPLLGRSYYQMGVEGRSNHKCQGMGQLHASAGPHDSVWRLEDSVIPVAEHESDLFDGVETGLDRLKAFSAAPFVREGIDALKVDVAAASAAYDPRAPWNTLPALRRGLVLVRKLRSELASSAVPASERYELEHRLAPKEKDFEKAIALAHGLVFVPTADRGEVTQGRSISRRSAGHESEPRARGDSKDRGGDAVGLDDGESRRRKDSLPRPSGNAVGERAARRTLRCDRRCRRRVRSTLLGEDRSFGGSVHASRARELWSPLDPSGRLRDSYIPVGRRRDSLERTVEYRYEGRWVGGEKQKQVSVLPLVSVTLTPDVVVFPAGADDKTRPVSVTALYKGREAVQGTLKLEAPSGWRVEPAESPLDFQREDQAVTVRFRLMPPETVATGDFQVRAVARLGDQEFREGVQTIQYDHIQTRYLYHPAEAKVEALDLQIAPVRVGYIEGVGDEVPEAIRQLGASLDFLNEDDLAEGDLSRYDVIVTGVRAYLNRQDLRAYNRRLLDYVASGGTLLVQYNKLEFNDAQWGPYPEKVTHNRVTVEEAPIHILVPDDPVFNEPNRITENDWGGWVQERGLYFLSDEGDPRYRDLISSEDPWPYNAGVKKGILVEARYGKGRWIYMGLGFFRQLPAGVPSAYRLFANLLSLPKTAAAPAE